MCLPQLHLSCFVAAVAAVHVSSGTTVLLPLMLVLLFACYVVAASAVAADTRAAVAAVAAAHVSSTKTLPLLLPLLL